VRARRRPSATARRGARRAVELRADETHESFRRELVVASGHGYCMRVVPDSELWQRAVAGDPRSFGDLFERHARAISVFCFRRTADWALAEDLTSVVFLEAWRRRSDVRLVRESALPWLFGIATNVLRNQRRSLRRHRAALERLPLEHEPDFADEAAERLDDERRMQEILAAFAALPQREREVIVLCRWSELSYEEAAVALGVPVGTVRSRLARARVRLGELGEGNGHEPDDNPADLAEEAV
jgi:RNA polymerase sigma factor (sigma-70 family)